MSLFRFGLVGPNCKFNLFEWVLGKRTTRKGNWLIFQYFFSRVFVNDGDINLIYFMVDCRTQQTFRVFLTKDFKSYII